MSAIEQTIDATLDANGQLTLELPPKGSGLYFAINCF